MPLVYVPDNTFASPYLNPYVSHYPAAPTRRQRPSYDSAPSHDDYDELAHYFYDRPSARAAQLQQQRQEELEDARTRQLFSQFLGGFDSTPKPMVGQQRRRQQAAYVAEQQRRRLMLARQQQEEQQRQLEQQRRQQMLRLQVQQRTQQEHARRLAAQQYTREQQQQLARPWDLADAAASDSDTDEEMEDEQPRHHSSPVASRNSSPTTRSIFADQLGALMNFSAVRSDAEDDEQEQEQPTSPIQRRSPSPAASASTITTARSPSPAQSSSSSTRSSQPSALTQLRRLQERTTSLIANTSTAPLLESTHYLTQVLLEADAIDAQGEALVRSERKKLVQRVEEALRELEREDQEEDEGSDASTEVSSSSEDKEMIESAGFESKAESSSASSSSSYNGRRAYKVTIEDASESDLE